MGNTPPLRLFYQSKQRGNILPAIDLLGIIGSSMVELLVVESFVELVVVSVISVLFICMPPELGTCFVTF